MIVTPLDSATLDSKEQYVFYHKMIDFTLKELITAVQAKQILNQQEILLFKQYTDLLLYSIEAMRVKYMYDEDEHMKVDLTDSSFPNYLEFRYLFNDLELREEFLSRLTDIDVLKDEFLDTLMRKKQPISSVSCSKQHPLFIIPLPERNIFLIVLCKVRLLTLRKDHLLSIW